MEQLAELPSTPTKVSFPDRTATSHLLSIYINF